MKIKFKNKPVYEIVTRALNFTVAFAGLIIISPLMLLIALAIKISDPKAPVFYRGRRIGKDGRPYTILKFRTMSSGTEQRLGARLIENGSQSITPIGSLLRKRKLDELPQLLNVMWGDMNLVGPRPVREVFLTDLRQRIPGYDHRFRIRPGVTGLAQVNGGYYTDPRNKFRYEMLYMANRSLWVDLKIVFATVFTLVSKVLSLFGLLFSLIAFAVFVPTTFLPAMQIPVFGLRINVVLLLMACIAAGWLAQGWLRHKKFRLRKTPADRYIIGFVLWALLGASLNSDFLRNLLGVLYFTSGAFMVYFITIQSIRHNSEKIHRYMEMLGITTIVVSLCGIWQYIAPKGMRSLGAVQAISTLAEPDVLATYLAMLAPLMLYLHFSCKEKAGKIMWGGGITLATVCLLLCRSLCGYISFSGAILTFLFKGRRKMSYNVAGGCIIAAIIAAMVFTQNFQSSPLDLALSPADPGMIQQHVSRLNNFQHNLLLGVSWRNWRMTPEAEASPKTDISLGQVSLRNPINNMYITFLVEYGLVGLLLMLLVIITALHIISGGSRQIPDPSLQMLLWAIFSGAIGFMTSMLFFNSCYFIVIQVTFWFILGFGTGIAHVFGPVSQGWYYIRQFNH